MKHKNKQQLEQWANRLLGIKKYTKKKRKLTTKDKKVVSDYSNSIEFIKHL